jgi:hypothetical protein
MYCRGSEKCVLIIRIKDLINHCTIWHEPLQRALVANCMTNQKQNRFSSSNPPLRYCTWYCCRIKSVKILLKGTCTTCRHVRLNRYVGQPWQSPHPDFVDRPRFWNESLTVHDFNKIVDRPQYWCKSLTVHDLITNRWPSTIFFVFFLPPWSCHLTICSNNNNYLLTVNKSNIICRPSTNQKLLVDRQQYLLKLWTVNNIC